MSPVRDKQAKSKTTSAELEPLSPRLLVFFFWTALLVFLGPARYADEPPLWFIAVAITTALLIATWLWWFRSYSIIAAVAFAAECMVAVYLVELPLAFGMYWMALMVLTLTFSTRVTLYYVALQLLVICARNFLANNDVNHAISQTVMAVFFTYLGWNFASRLHQLDSLDQQRRETLVDLQEKLRISRQLVLTQERERIASSLHDNLGHRLTTIGMSLDYSLRVLDKYPDKAATEIERARDSASEALNAMRATVRAMRPVKLKDGSVKDTIESLAESFKTTGLTVTHDLTADIHDEELALLIIRTVQEALTNTVRHSEADRTHIMLNENSLSISDNGSGSDNPLDFGLTSLTETAQRLGASLKTEPHGGIDGGFRIDLSFMEQK